MPLLIDLEQSISNPEIGIDFPEQQEHIFQRNDQIPMPEPEMFVVKNFHVLAHSFCCIYLLIYFQNILIDIPLEVNRKICPFYLRLMKRKNGTRSQKSLILLVQTLALTSKRALLPIIVSNYQILSSNIFYKNKCFLKTKMIKSRYITVGFLKTHILCISHNLK